MKKSWIILLVMIILGMNVVSVLGEVRINEVMADPSDNCNDCSEWIEIYSNETTNLTNWKINTTNQQEIFNFYIADYLIITKNKTAFMQNWALISESKIIESNIGLVNGGESVFLFDNSSDLKSNITYPALTSNKTYSLLLNGSWAICNNPTPGTSNNCSSSTNTSTPSTTTPELSLDMDWDEDEIINGLEEFDIDIIAKNLDDEEDYDVKVWIQPDEDNETIISQTYNENDTWVSSNDYYNLFFENEINKTKSITLRIKDNYKTYHGDAIIKIRIRETGSSYIQDLEISKEIVILEKDEDNSTTTHVEEIEETLNQVVTTNNSQIKTIKLGSSLEVFNESIQENKNSIVYESSNEKIKKYAVFGFAGLCLVITILALFNKLN